MAVQVKSKIGKPVTLSTTVGASAKTFKARIEASWDVNKSGKSDPNKTFDVDISVVLRDAKGEAQALCYYDPESLNPFPGMEHSPDNTTGEGDGVDEFIKMALDANFPYPIADLYADIHDAAIKGQNWAMIDNAKIVVVDETTNNEIHIEPGMDLMAGGETSMWVARFFLEGGNWKLIEISEKYDASNTDLQAFADKMLPAAK